MVLGTAVLLKTIKKSTRSLALWSLYVLVLVAMALPYYVALPDVYSRMSARRMHNDFVTFYAAASLVKNRTTEPLNVYDYRQFSDYVLRYMPKPEAPISFFMAYPPFFMLLFSPLTFLDLQNAYLVFTLISVALTACALHLTAAGKLTKRGCAVATVITFCSTPCWYNLFGGQTAALLFFCFVSIWLLVRNQRYVAAGLVSGFSLLKLQFLPIVALSCLVLGRLPYLSASVISGAVFMVAGALFVGLENVHKFPASLLGNESQEVSHKFTIEANCRTVLGLIPGVTPDNATPIATIIFVLVVCACLFLWLHYYPLLSKKTNFAYELCASISTMCLVMFGIHGNMYDYLLMAVPFIWLWHIFDVLDSFDAPQRQLRRIARAAILAFPLITQPAIATPILASRGWSMAFFSTLLVLVLTVIQTRFILRDNLPNQV